MHEKHSPPAKLNPTVLCNGSVCGGGFSQRWKSCSSLGERRFWGVHGLFGLVVVVQVLQEHEAGRKMRWWTVRRWWTSPLGFDPLPVLSF